MKKLFMLLMLVFPMAMASHHAFAQEITITLTPGWNWISYTNAEAMDIVSALGDFVPVDGDRIQSISGNSTYNGGIWRGGFTQFMPGCGYMYYSARTETVEFVFAHAASSNVVTATPTAITAISAVVGGMVTVSEGGHVFLRGICWGTETNPTIDGNHTSEEPDTGSFNSTLEGLNLNTTYYVRAYAVTDHGLAYGNEVTFTTMNGIPVVITAEASNITGITATCGGTVTDDGGLAVTARGVCWSTSHNPTLSDSYTSNGTGMGSFSSNLTNLTLGTTYYVRAYATTAEATSYGEEKTFTTLSNIPTLTTSQVIDVCPTTAICGGNVTGDGDETVTARGVCWSTSTNPTISDNHTTDGTGTGSFNSIVTGLTPGTTYYLRAYATNRIGTAYGTQRTFTTLTTAVSNVGIIAHRGFHKFMNASGSSVMLPGSAENSIYAAQQAIANDFEGTEFDVQITSDNQLIIYHDFKMTGNNNYIYNLSYATLQNLAAFTLENGESVPTLPAMLAACRESLVSQEQRLGARHTKLFIEVKTRTGTNGMSSSKINTLVNKVVQYVQAYQLQDDVFFISFDMNVCQMLTQRMPNVPVAYLSDDRTSAPALSPQDLLNDYGISHMDYKYDLLQSNSQWFSQAHNLGMTVNAWTVNNQTLTNQMRTLGVDYITTNHPLNMRAWLASEP